MCGPTTPLCVAYIPVHTYTFVFKDKNASCGKKKVLIEEHLVLLLMLLGTLRCVMGASLLLVLLCRSPWHMQDACHVQGLGG